MDESGGMNRAMSMFRSSQDGFSVTFRDQRRRSVIANRALMIRGIRSKKIKNLELVTEWWCSDNAKMIGSPRNANVGRRHPRQALAEICKIENDFICRNGTESIG